MSVCPKCQSQNPTEYKTWNIKPKRGKDVVIRVAIYVCSSCGNKFRKATKMATAPTPVSEALEGSTMTSPETPEAMPQTSTTVAPIAGSSIELHKDSESTSEPVVAAQMEAEPQSASEEQENAGNAEASQTQPPEGSLPTKRPGSQGGFFHRLKERFHNFF